MVITEMEQQETKRKLLDATVERLTQDWFVAQCQNPCAKLYLYRMGSEYGVREQCEYPAGATLMSDRRISPMWSQSQAQDIIRMMILGLPF